MANRIQIRRGTANSLIGKQVYQGELLWVTDKEKLYIGKTNGTVEGSFPTYENSSTHESVVKVISPDAKEVAYDNTTSGLTAENVQDAIDELQDNITTAYNDLDDKKQNRPQSAVINNIAVFDANKDTIDSGKKFVTSVAAAGSVSDNNIPTEQAVRTAITDAMTAAVNYKGACKESELPGAGDPKKLGDYWTITDFDITYPSKHRDGRAIWNGSSWDKVVDDFYGPDDEYIELTTSISGNDGSTSSPKLTLKNQTRTDTTSSQTATYAGQVNVVDSVTTNSKGQVTAVNVKSVTMPALGKNAGQAAKGDEAEYTVNKTTVIRGISTADDTKYPTEKAVRTELDTKIDKILNLSASTNYSLVNYNSDGAVISGTDIIDGGSF